MTGGNPMAQDVDQDYLSDECEYRLAWAFAPDIMLSSRDPCPGGEPYWAAKYFDDPASFGWGRFVRVAYLLSYYADCGAGGHNGDSEFLDVQVTYNPGTQHWELQQLFTSAHFLALNSNSTWTSSANLVYPSGVIRSYPRVWASTGKHANYTGPGCGNIFHETIDECELPFDAGRVKVYQYHNIGQPGHPRIDCVASINPMYWTNGLRECYQSGTMFQGWQGGATSSTPYRVSLHTWAHDCWLYDGFDCYYGPAGPGN